MSEQISRNPRHHDREVDPVPIGKDELGPERERPFDLRPCVWIGCVAAYDNDGTLHGDWAEADVEDDVLAESARKVLTTSPQVGAAEWGIFNQDEFGSYQVREDEPLESVARVARGIKQHGWPFSTWAERHRDDDSMLDQFEDAYIGHFESVSDWARHLLDDIGLEDVLLRTALPPTVVPYIRMDYEAWAHDAQLGSDIEVEPAPDGGVYVFHAH